MGAIILPSNSPNFTQTLFNGFKSFELSKPRTKKIIEIGKDHNRNGFPLTIGQKAIIAKRMLKSIKGYNDIYSKLSKRFRRN